MLCLLAFISRPREVQQPFRMPCPWALGRQAAPTNALLLRPGCGPVRRDGRTLAMDAEQERRWRRLLLDETSGPPLLDRGGSLSSFDGTDHSAGRLPKPRLSAVSAGLRGLTGN
jgi:hypothetical protein